MEALIAFKKLGFCDRQAETKRRIVAALYSVSEKLGNTRSVCKKHYVHPTLISLYENKTLEPYLHKLDYTGNEDGIADHTVEEKVLMKILEKHG